MDLSPRYAAKWPFRSYIAYDLAHNVRLRTEVAVPTAQALTSQAELELRGRLLVQGGLEAGGEALLTARASKTSSKVFDSSGRHSHTPSKAEVNLMYRLGPRLSRSSTSLTKRMPLLSSLGRTCDSPLKAFGLRI